MKNGIFPAMRINMNVIVISHCSPPMWGLFTLFMEFLNHIVKAMAFPVVMYRCDSWTIKKAECRRVDVSELRCWRRLLRVPWTARRSNHSILKEITPEYSLEGLMLKLKLQFFGHLTWRTDSLGKTWCWERLRVARKGDNRGWDGWMASPSQWTWF